jgi:puromycin-sensitive aminopeptidase
MDPYRLPRHILPTRYDIRLEPDLTAETFEGDVTISLRVLHPASEIVLNAAAELEIFKEEVEIEDESGASQRAERVEPEEETERCRLAFRDTIMPGTWSLRLRFKGRLTKEGTSKTEGFYLSTYEDHLSGAERRMASTQFEPTAARQAFPCWDEPTFKAVFALTLVIDPALKAVSNAPVLGELLEGDRKVVRFADTIPMSTYLVAFVVGDLQTTKPSLARTPLRVWYVPDTPDKRRLADFGQRFAKSSLEFFEEYYGQPYPGAKLDLLAIPNFRAGAMENFGAITFRESALLVDERQASRAELQSVADTVAHENAHMWFGDLVTMAWWDGLWLNEAFATFMSILPVDRWKPEWQRWTTFGLAEREAGMGVDGLHSTRPIEFKMADDPHDIGAMFDAITYRKGASVLRMLEQYLHPDVFRAGVREYLRQHAYGNATTDDLWAALGQAAGRDVAAIMEGWIRQPGFPLISVGHEKQNQQLVLKQQRFTYLKKPLSSLVDGAQAAGEQDRRLWQVPIELSITADGETTVRQLLLKDADERLEVPENLESVRVNESGHGSYRVHYDLELREELLGRLPDLSPIERLNLTKDAWATVLTEIKAWRMSLTQYLELATRLAKLDGEDGDYKNVWKNVWVWSFMIQTFAVLNRIIDPEYRPKLEAFVRQLVEPTFDKLGWKPQPGENPLIPQLRADLARILGTLGNHPGVQHRAVEIYEEYKNNPAAVDGGIVAAVIGVLAHAGDGTRYEEFFNNFKSATTPQDRNRYLYALTAFRFDEHPDLLQKTLDKLQKPLDKVRSPEENQTTEPDEIRSQDAPIVVQLLLMSVYGRERAWSFVKDYWQEMSTLYEQGGLSRVCQGLIGLSTPELASDVDQEVRKVKIDGQTPQPLQQYLGGKTLEQILERLRIFAVLSERDGENLRDYLAEFTPSAGEEVR